ncbi:HAD family hydrolase [Nocardia sp. MW-W600-9]
MEVTWRLVLFDFDGVLCDSREMAIDYVEELRLDPGFAGLPSVRADGHFGELYRGELRSALHRFGISPEESRRFFASHAESMRGRVADLRLFDGVVQGLRSLPRSSYAIITSAYSDAVRAIFEHSGIGTDGLEIIGHEIRTTKTQKARDLLAKRGIDPSDAIYVGDMESDIEYCRGLGLRCIAATYGYHPDTVLRAASPFALVDSPDELFTHLQKGLITA